MSLHARDILKLPKEPAKTPANFKDLSIEEMERYLDLWNKEWHAMYPVKGKPKKRRRKRLPSGPHYLKD